MGFLDRFRYVDPVRVAHLLPETAAEKTERKRHNHQLLVTGLVCICTFWVTLIVDLFAMPLLGPISSLNIVHLGLSVATTLVAYLILRYVRYRRSESTR